MIYTDDWAFMHIPKSCGQMFVESVPKEKIRGKFYCPENTKVSKESMGMWKHQPIPYQIKHNPDLANIQWITIVRHPADRLVGFYFIFKKRLKEDRGVDWDTSFKTWIMNDGPWKKPDEQFILEGGLWETHYPQHYWVINSSWTTMLKDSGLSLGMKPKWTSNVLTFRMEDQLKDLEDYVGFRLQRRGCTMLPTINDSWKTYYTDEMREIVYERYRQDFESFGYNV